MKYLRNFQYNFYFENLDNMDPEISAIKSDIKRVIKNSPNLGQLVKSFKYIAITLLIIFFVNSSAHAAKILSKETIADGVRKLIVQRDDGSKFEKFEMCDNSTSAWYEAQFDTTSNRWVFPQAGAEAKERIQTLHRRWEREDRRQD